MYSMLTIEPVLDIPLIKPDDDLTNIILEKLSLNKQRLNKGDIICVASKIISISENRFVDLKSVDVSASALELHDKIPRKDPRVLQIILDQAANDENNLRINGSWIGVINDVGRILTSGGVDKVNDDTVILLPEDPGASARKIGMAFKASLGHDIGVLITDSDGREGISGATQIAIGLYGIPPLRQENDSQETACDMLAAAAGLVMGQRGNNIPVVIIRGYQYDFDSQVNLQSAY